MITVELTITDPEKTGGQKAVADSPATHWIIGEG